MTHWMVNLALAGSLALTAPAAVTLTPQPDGTIVLEHDTIRLVVDPVHGGSVISFIYQPAGADVVPPQRGHDQMGLLLDHYWEDGWPWPGEMMTAAYAVVNTTAHPAEAAVTMRCPLKGAFAGNHDPKVEGLVFEKTIRLRDGVEAVFCDGAFSNPGPRSAMVAYWVQNYFLIGGDYDAQRDVFARPTTRGIRHEGRGSSGLEDFARNVSRGWSAATDMDKSFGLVFLMDYNDLNSLYNFANNTTLEWIYDKTLIPAGKTWRTSIILLPFLRVPDLACASPRLLAGLSVARQGDRITLTHTLRQGLSPAHDVQLQVQVVSGADQQSVEQSLAIGPLGSQPRVVQQELPRPLTDPLIIKVTATGAAEDGPVREDYWDFHVGAYGYGANIQMDMITPLYQEPRPARQKILLKPDVIERIRDGRCFFRLEGLLADNYRLEEICRALARPAAMPDLPESGAYVVNTYGMGPQISQFPLDYDQLMRYAAVIVANVNLESLGPVGRQMLADYVTHGGGLLVLGGRASYATGGWRGSPLEALLPFKLATGASDLHRLEVGELHATTPHPITAGLDWTSHPRCAFIHQVANVDRDAQVLIHAAGQPFLIVAQRGQGRIACILGTPYGGPSENNYAEWRAWPNLTTRLLQWLDQGKLDSP